MTGDSSKGEREGEREKAEKWDEEKNSTQEGISAAKLRDLEAGEDTAGARDV